MFSNKEGETTRVHTRSSFGELGDMLENPPSRAFEKESIKEDSEHSAVGRDDLTPVKPSSKRKSSKLKKKKSKRKLMPPTSDDPVSGVVSPSISGRPVPTSTSSLPTLVDQSETPPSRSFAMSVNMAGFVVANTNDGAAPTPQPRNTRTSITTADIFPGGKKRTGSSGDVVEKSHGSSSMCGKSRNSFAGLDLEQSTEIAMQQAVAAAESAGIDTIEDLDDLEGYIDRSELLTEIHEDQEQLRQYEEQRKSSRTPKYHNHPLMPFGNSTDEFDFDAGTNNVEDEEASEIKKPSSFGTRMTSASGSGIPASITASMNAGTVASNSQPRRPSDYKPRRRHYESEDQRAKRHQRLMTTIGIIIVILLIGVIALMFVIGSRALNLSNEVVDGDGGTPIVDTFPPTASPTQAPTRNVPTELDPNSMLAKITEQRGFLKCGIPTEQPGFAVYDTNRNDFVGFDVDMCRAVAAALFGTSQDRVEFRTVTASDRFSVLQSGEVDMLARTTTHTMERQLFEPTTGSGFSFSIPYLYNGLYFAGDPFFVECADTGNSTEACAETSICLLSATTHADVIISVFPDAPSVIQARSSNELYNQFMNGDCNVIAGEQFDVAPSILRDMGHGDMFVMGNVSHSKEPLALVTRSDDTQWSDFVNWVLQGLIASEENGVTQQKSWTLSQTEVFGGQFSNTFIDAVREVGNYAEIYERHLSTILSRPTANMLNVGISGVLYGMPFGNLMNDGNTTVGSQSILGPVKDGQLQKIIQRGYLRCGVSLRVIFAQNDEDNGEWTGFDVDFCRAVSAAIFGRSDNVEFSSLSASERFFALESGDVDLLSRLTTVTLSRDVMEANVGKGFSFSQPNFYDGLTFGGIPPFVQCADSLDVISLSCRDLRICVIKDTTFQSKLADLLPGRVIVPQESWDAVYEAIDNGDCNTIAGGVSDVSMTSVRGNGYNGIYQTGLNRYSKDPLAVVTRQRDEDTQWSTFVYWVVSALFRAEEQGITQDTASEEMPEVPYFGPDLSNMLRNAVQEVGSYAEIYERNAEVEVSRGGLNLINFGLGGPQHYPLPGVKVV